MVGSFINKSIYFICPPKIIFMHSASKIAKKWYEITIEELKNYWVKAQTGKFTYMMFHPK